jgi:DNA-binding CsgD family transcriptional regulator
MEQQTRADMISAIPHRAAWRDIHDQIAPRTDAALLGMMAALDAMRRPGLVIGMSAQVLCRNDSANAVLGQWLLISRGRLRAVSRGADVALQDLFLRVTCDANPAAFALPASVALPSADARPLIVQAAPLHAADPDIFGDAKALVTINRLERPSDTAVGSLCEAFGLTAAEHRLAREMASGVGLVAASASLGVAMSTVRTHLKSIFAKTRTRSQSELAALLSRVGH